MILVTGCCGYIGSHVVTSLLENYDVVGIDNFSNSKKEILDKFIEITEKKVKFYEGDILDSILLDKIFNENKIDMVIDFAAFKSVGDSVLKPIEYYTNNVSSLLNLVTIMKKHNVYNLVFSSSATVYGDCTTMPINENCLVGGTTNPYGTSKLFCEKILTDLCNSDDKFNVCILRYFNPVGAHFSGLIGENPNGIPANLMPYISKVAMGELEILSIYGNDYDTIDGTGVRDYIHVCDLATAHVLAVNKLFNDIGLFIYNVGTGKGVSVLELVNTYISVNNVNVPYKIVGRRAGDIATCYTDCDKIYKELGFESLKTVEDMCRDAHNFMINNKK